MKRFQLAYISAAIFFWTPATFAASEYVVVAVDPATDVPVLGKLYKVGDSLHVERGSTVTLMGDDGSVIALPGPTDIVVTQDDVQEKTQRNRPSRLGIISNLLMNGAGQVQSIGASRGEEATATKLRPWTVPIESDTGCICSGRLELWREPTETASVRIVLDGKFPGVDLTWPSGRQALAFPETVPPQSQTVELVLDKREFIIGLRHLPSDVGLGDNVALFTWMIESGCAQQAFSLIHELEESPQGR